MKNFIYIISIALMFASSVFADEQTETVPMSIVAEIGHIHWFNG